MDNIIIPVVNENMVEFAERLKKRSDLLVIIGVVKDLESKIKRSRKANVIIKVFENNSKKEEIINSLKDEIEEGRVVICRKSITDEELFKFLSSSNDITVCKEKRNKFQEFFFGIWQVLMKFLFGFEFFYGDISIVAFNQKLFPVLKNIENLSYSSRVNKWKDVEIGFVEVATPPVKKEYDKLKINVLLYSWIFLFLLVITSAFVYFYYVRGTFLTGLLYAFAILIAQIFLIISIAIYYMNLRCGQRVFNRAKKFEEVKWEKLNLV